MRNLILTILCAISLTVSAQNADPVSMASYEQTHLDIKGALALKNNTEEQIHNVTFRITYQDMAGNDLDYEEYTRKVDIEPGMTRKVDVPAYEGDRNYEYYKTVRSSGSYPTFKVKYEFIGYNEEEANSAESEDDDFSEAAGAATGMIIGIVIVALLFISISVGLYVMVAVIAQKYERNVILWLVLSFVASPLLILIILLCIGKEGEKPTRERY